MLRDKFSPVIGETTPYRFGVEAEETASTTGRAASTTWQMPWPASWSELLATSRRWKSVGALGACAGDPWKFETVYHQGRPRNFNQEFGGWADKQNYPEHTENWESRRRMNISERWCRGSTTATARCGSGIALARIPDIRPAGPTATPSVSMWHPPRCLMMNAAEILQLQSAARCP
jgi:hypothetical protein